MADDFSSSSSATASGAPPATELVSALCQLSAMCGQSYLAQGILLELKLGDDAKLDFALRLIEMPHRTRTRCIEPLQSWTGIKNARIRAKARVITCSSTYVQSCKPHMRPNWRHVRRRIRIAPLRVPSRYRPRVRWGNCLDDKGTPAERVHGEWRTPIGPCSGWCSYVKTKILSLGFLMVDVLNDRPLLYSKMAQFATRSNWQGATSARPLSLYSLRRGRAKTRSSRWSTWLRTT